MPQRARRLDARGAASGQVGRKPRDEQHAQDHAHILDQAAAALVAAREGRAHVLAAGGAAPAGLALREDLRTRLGWGLVYQLKPLTDVQKAMHLRAEAGRRGLRLTDEVVWYLLHHLPRDLASLNAVLETLDRHSLARQRPITLPLIREALSEKNDG